METLYLWSQFNGIACFCFEIFELFELFRLGILDGKKKGSKTDMEL